MKKRAIWGAGVVAVVLAATGVLVYAHKAPAAEKPQCLASSAKAAPTDKDLNDIQMAAMEADMTVPAGTNADVRVATYDGSAATGSVIYGKNYGAYNYSVSKDTSRPARPNYVNWKLDSVTPCRQ